LRRLLIPGLTRALNPTSQGFVKLEHFDGS
jgi:hypothetical protein